MQRVCLNFVQRGYANKQAAYFHPSIPPPSFHTDAPPGEGVELSAGLEHMQWGMLPLCSVALSCSVSYAFQSHVGVRLRLAAALDSLLHVHEELRVGSVRPHGRGGSRHRAKHFPFSLPNATWFRESHTPEHKQSMDVSCFMFCFLLQHLGDSKAGYEKIPRMPSISGVVCGARDIKGSVSGRGSAERQTPWSCGPLLPVIAAFILAPAEHGELA